MNKKKIVQYFSLVLLGYVIVNAPRAFKNFQSYGKQTRALEANILLECVSKNPECVPEGLSLIEKATLPCPKVSCFESHASWHYRSIKKIKLANGDQLLMVWSNLAEEENLNLQLWAKLNQDPPVRCIDGTDTKDRRVSNEKPCDLLKLVPSIELR